MPSLDYIALLPEFTIAAAFVVLIVVDLILGDGRKAWLTPIAIIGTLVSLVTVIVLAVTGHDASMVNGTYVVDEFALVTKGLFLATGAIVFLFGAPRQWKGEYFALILASLLGMVMLPSSRDLITFFVAFELLAVPGYLLAGWRKYSNHGHEAALKYYLLGVLATAVMLYGLSLLFGVAGSTSFSAISESLRVDDLTALASIAVLFVLIGMGFKIAAVPFHFWAPDVYEGAPLPVAAFLAVVSKAAGLVGLALLVTSLFPTASEVWSPFLWAVAALTMIVGNLVALRQNDIIRLLAWSSVGQAGFLLVPLAVAGEYGGSLPFAISVIIDYLIFYALATFAAFAVVLVVKRLTNSTRLDSFRGLFQSHPGRAVALAVSMLSLAGIPPLGGWFAKFLVFDALVEAHSAAAYGLGVIAALMTAVSLVYYATVVRQLWLPTLWEPTELGENSVDEQGVTKATPDTLGLRLLVVGMPIFVLVSGVLPGLVTFFGSSSSLGM